MRKQSEVRARYHECWDRLWLHRYETRGGRRTQPNMARHIRAKLGASAKTPLEPFEVSHLEGMVAALSWALGGEEVSDT